MPLFNKCPHCHKHPMAIGVKLIIIRDLRYDEWYCGECGRVVGTTRAPAVAVPAVDHAAESWNLLVGRVN